MLRFKNIIAASFICFFGLSSQAQLFLEDYALFPDQFIQKKIHDNPDIAQFYPFIDGHGNYPNLSNAKEFPKKIALVSFYVWDNSIVITNKSASEYWAQTGWIDAVRGNKLSASLLSYSIESIVARFDSLGSTLITPENFTVDQKEFYNSMNVQYSNSYRKKISDTSNYDLCTSSPYKFIKLPNSKLDPAFSNSFAELAKKLNVDAVIIIENQISNPGSYGIINTITMNMYGFNPVETDTSALSHKKQSKFYNFMLYSSIEMDLNAIVSEYGENKELLYENCIGYDRLLDLMIDKLYTSYMDRTKITPKKA
jgi:hypothetical protein